MISSAVDARARCGCLQFSHGWARCQRAPAVTPRARKRARRFAAVAARAAALEGAAVCAECRRHLARRLDEPAGVPIGLASLSLPASSSSSGAALQRPGAGRVHALKYDGEQRLVAPLAELHGRALAAGRHRRRLARACAGSCRAATASAASTRPSCSRAPIGQELGLPSRRPRSAHAKTAAQHSLGRRRAPRTSAAPSSCARATRSAGARPLDRPGRRRRDDGRDARGCARALYEAGAVGGLGPRARARALDA